MVPLAVPITHTFNGMKHLLILPLISLLLGGCLDRKIYTEVADKRYLAHPPASIRIDDGGYTLPTGLKSNPDSVVWMEVYVHRAQCSNPQSKSLGADFDGYIRITLREGNETIARAQMDYKGEVKDEEVIAAEQKRLAKILL